VRSLSFVELLAQRGVITAREKAMLQQGKIPLPLPTNRRNTDRIPPASVPSVMSAVTNR
jgi:hypothetical protein